MLYQPFITSYSPELTITKDNTRRGSLDNGILTIGTQVIWNRVTSPYMYNRNGNKHTHTNEESILIAHTGIYTPCIDGGYDHDTVIAVCVVYYYEDNTYFIHKNYSNNKDYNYYYSLDNDAFYKVYFTPNGVGTMWREDGARRCTATPSEQIMGILDDIGAIEVDHLDVVGIAF